jgi:hypothetical protein
MRDARWIERAHGELLLMKMKETYHSKLLMNFGKLGRNALPSLLNVVKS